MLPIQRGVTNDTRQKNRRDFVSVFVSSALVTAAMVIIWAVTGAGAFWPIWVIFGLSVVVLASAWRPSARNIQANTPILTGRSIASRLINPGRATVTSQTWNLTPTTWWWSAAARPA